MRIVLTNSILKNSKSEHTIIIFCTFYNFVIPIIEEQTEVLHEISVIHVRQ